MRQKLTDSDAFVRRAAVDALGRHPDPANIGPLMTAWSSTPNDDNHLIHTIRMAVRDHLKASGGFAAVGPLLSDAAARERLVKISCGVPTPEAAAFLLEALRTDAKLPDRHMVLHAVIRYLPEDKLGDAYQSGAGLGG